MKYTGLSIGPIYKTLMDARKTREIWGASYIFSYIMKNIIKNLSHKDFLTPYFKKEELEKTEKIGKFHDRLIFEGDMNELDEAIEKVKNGLKETFKKDLGKNDSKIDNFVDNYFKFYKVEKEFEKIESENSPIRVINEWLNVKELFFEVKNYEKNYLFEWIRLPWNKNSILSELEKEGKFKSLPEIALNELIKKDESIKNLIKKSFSKDEVEIFEEIEEKYKDLKPYHKYIAIVQADGDNLSKALENIPAEKINLEVKNISEKLFDFAKKAAEEINDFGGEVIYAGGDDLLFFAPVKNENGTVFDLIKRIEQIYKEKNIHNSTISFGVSVTYYKFPLNEALSQAGFLLFERAKNQKNSTAFRVIKHSGQYFESVFSNEILEEFLSMTRFEGDEEFLHSLYTKISYYKDLLKFTDEKRIDNFFENNFNENYDTYKRFFEKTASYYKNLVKKELLQLKSEKNSSEDKIFEAREKSIEDLYATLRFMKFLKGDKDEKN